jgi:uncharacterized membrane protein (TIGR02234 family)
VVGTALVLAASAVMLWAASAVTWVDQRYRTPFSGDVTFSATGATVRPELVPLALVALAAIAAVLATGRWLRRVLGVVLCLAGAFLAWRGVGLPVAGSYPSVPPGSTPISAPAANPVGPALMVVAALALVAAGFLVARYARKLPEMGAKYAAPGRKRVSKDPHKQLWDALDEGEDPTDG